MHNKRNHKKKKTTKKRTLRRRQKSLQTKQPIGINPQTMQTANSAQYKKKKKTQMDRRSKYTVLQRRNIDGQKAHEKMLNINNY